MTRSSGSSPLLTVYKSPFNPMVYGRRFPLMRYSFIFALLQDCRLISLSAEHKNSIMAGDGRNGLFPCRDNRSIISGNTKCCRRFLVSNAPKSCKLNGIIKTYPAHWKGTGHDMSVGHIPNFALFHPEIRVNSTFRKGLWVFHNINSQRIRHFPCRER